MPFAKAQSQLPPPLTALAGDRRKKQKVDARPPRLQLSLFPPPPFPQPVRPLLQDDNSADNDMPMPVRLSWAADISQGKSRPAAPHPFPCCRVSLNRVGEAVNNKSARFFSPFARKVGAPSIRCFFLPHLRAAGLACLSSCLCGQLPRTLGATIFLFLHGGPWKLLVWMKLKHLRA